MMSEPGADWDDVLDRARRLADAQSEALPPGAAATTLDDFESARGLRLPDELRDWLLLSNGPRIGPGGTFGVGTAHDRSEIGFYLDLFPSWGAEGWLPIASDGSGNYFVVRLADGGVYFIDVSLDPEELCYSVASGVRTFFRFLFDSELGEGEWPFGEEYVVERDGQISDLQEAPLPWLA